MRPYSLVGTAEKKLKVPKYIFLLFAIEIIVNLEQAYNNKKTRQTLSTR